MSPEITRKFLSLSAFDDLKVYLFSKDSSMLDGLDTVSIEMEAAKVCSMTGDIFLSVCISQSTRLLSL